MLIELFVVMFFSSIAVEFLIPREFTGLPLLTFIVLFICICYLYSKDENLEEG